jgi:hypothetical protein
MKCSRNVKRRLYKQLWKHDLQNGRSSRIISLCLHTFLERALHSEFILVSITGNLSAVSGAEFQELVPVVCTMMCFHLSLCWNQHIGHAPRVVLTRRVLEYLKKGKEVAKREHNLASVSTLQEVQ